MKSSENPFCVEYIFNIDNLLGEIERQKHLEQQRSLEEKRDWMVYLQEGFEKFQLPPDYSVSLKIIIIVYVSVHNIYSFVNYIFYTDQKLPFAKKKEK